MIYGNHRKDDNLETHTFSSPQDTETMNSRQYQVLPYLLSMEAQISDDSAESPYQAWTAQLRFTLFECSVQGRLTAITNNLQI